MEVIEFRIWKFSHIVFFLVFQEIEGCSYSRTSMSDSFTSPYYPITYSAHLHCTYTISTDRAVTLTFDRVRIEANNNDRILIKDNGALVGQLTGNWDNFQVPIPSSRFAVEFITDHSVEYEGFTASYTAYQCDASSTSSTGTFTSPGFGSGSYYNGLSCTYTIDARSSSSLVSITLNSFNTEECCDRLTITPSETEITPYTYKGAKSGQVIPRVSAKFTLVFYSDYNSKYTGFSLSWQASASFDESFTGSSGSLTSPYYNAVYVNDLTTTYTIDSSPVLINLRFPTFDTQADVDTVQVYDRNGTLLESLSGSLGYHVTITSNYYRLDFSTDGSTVKQGFSATWNPAVLPTVAGSMYVDCINMGFEAVQPNTDITMRAMERNIGVTGSQCMAMCAQLSQCVGFQVSGDECLWYENGPQSTTNDIIFKKQLP